MCAKTERLFLYDHFVLGCPLPGVSGAGLILQALKNISEAQSACMLDDYFRGVESVYTNEKVERIGKWLRVNKHANNNIPRGSTEFVCYSIPDKKHFVNNYKINESCSDITIDKDANSYISLRKLDGLLRHFRNSFAHGHYCSIYRQSSVTNKRMHFYYCQDVNKNNNITARMYISFRRLQMIANTFYEVEHG